MEQAILIFIGLVLSVAFGIRIGWVLSARSYGGWLVRPHTPATLVRMPDPEPTEAPEPSAFYVAEGRFVNQGFPGGGSRME